MKAITAAALALAITSTLTDPRAALAWGDDGHKVVALIAEHYLTPTTRKHVDAMLAADTDELTKHDIASEATWADKYRDANHRKDHYEATKRWHFVDLEITDPGHDQGLLRAKAAAAGHAGLDRRQDVVRGRQGGAVRRRA